MTFVEALEWGAVIVAASSVSDGLKWVVRKIFSKRQEEQRKPQSTDYEY